MREYTVNDIEFLDKAHKTLQTKDGKYYSKAFSGGYSYWYEKGQDYSMGDHSYDYFFVTGNREHFSGAIKTLNSILKDNEIADNKWKEVGKDEQGHSVKQRDVDKGDYVFFKTVNGKNIYKKSAAIQQQEKDAHNRQTEKIVKIMQDANVFVSPYDENKSRDMEAYNTVFSFNNFDKVWDEKLVHSFSKDTLIVAMNDIGANGYLSPIAKLVALQFSRKLKVPLRESLSLKNVLYNIKKQGVR